jgi:hypothetical protein
MFRVYIYAKIAISNMSITKIKNQATEQCLQFKTKNQTKTKIKNIKTTQNNKCILHILNIYKDIEYIIEKKNGRGIHALTVGGLGQCWWVGGVGGWPASWVELA